jgi:hypothetical protein
MSGGKYYTMYRKILQVAWKRTKERRHLWIFGFFAALLSTGGVADLTMQSLQQIRSSGRWLQQAFSGVFFNLETWTTYVRQLSFLEPTRVTLTLTAVILALLALVSLAVISQGALVYALTKRKSYSLKRAIRESARHFWSILGLNLVTKAAQFVLVLTTALPTVLFFARGSLFDAFLTFLIFLILFPATIALHIVSMIALVDIVRLEHSLPDAIHHAAKLFKKHWLVTLELGLIIFFIAFGAGALLIATLIMLAIPYTAVSLLTFYTTPILVTLLQALTIAVLGAVIIIFTGGLTTFQYACWVRWFERSTHGSTKDKVMAKLERWWRQAWS